MEIAKVLSGEKKLTTSQKLATTLAMSDFEMISALVEIRKSLGLNQAELAEIMGVTQQAISKFERMDSDPRLSTIRRYAIAVGAIINHNVVKNNARPKKTSSPA